MWIVGCREVLQPFVGRLIGGAGRAQIERNPAEQPLVLGHMRLADLNIGFCAGMAQGLHRTGFRVAAHVLGVYKVGGGGNQERDGIRLADIQFLITGFNTSSLGDSLDPRLVIQPPFDPLVGGVVTAQHKAVGWRTVRGVVLAFGVIHIHPPTDAGLQGDAARLACRQPDGDDLIDGAAQNFAGKLHVAHLVSNVDNSFVQVKRATVFRRARVSWKSEPQISQRLVGHLIGWVTHHLAAKQVVGLQVLAGKHQAAYFRQGIRPSGCIRIVRSPAPERLLVELNSLLLRAAHDHGAKPAVADGKRFGPLLCRLAIPQLQLGRDGCKSFGLGKKTHSRGQQARGTCQQSLTSIATRNLSQCFLLHKALDRNLTLAFRSRTNIPPLRTLANSLA